MGKNFLKIMCITAKIDREINLYIDSFATKAYNSF